MPASCVSSHMSANGPKGDPAGQEGGQSDGLGLPHSQAASINSKSHLRPPVVGQLIPQNRCQPCCHALVETHEAVSGNSVAMTAKQVRGLAVVEISKNCTALRACLAVMQSMSPLHTSSNNAGALDVLAGPVRVTGSVVRSAEQSCMAPSCRRQQRWPGRPVVGTEAARSLRLRAHSFQEASAKCSLGP